MPSTRILRAVRRSTGLAAGAAVLTGALAGAGPPAGFRKGPGRWSLSIVPAPAGPTKEPPMAAHPAPVPSAARRAAVAVLLLLAAVAALTTATPSPAGADGACPLRAPKVVGGTGGLDSNGDGKADFAAVLLDTDNDPGCMADAVGLSTDGDAVIQPGERIVQCPPPHRLPVVVLSRRVDPRKPAKGIVVEIFCQGIQLDKPNRGRTFAFVVNDLNGDGDTKDPGEVVQVRP